MARRASWKQPLRLDDAHICRKHDDLRNCPPISPEGHAPGRVQTIMNEETTNPGNPSECEPDAKRRIDIGDIIISDAVFAKLLIPFAIALALLVYGYEIANFSLSIDEEVKWWYSTENWLAWVGQGRWGMGLLVYVMPKGLSSMPFLPTLLFAIGMAISAVIFSRVITDSRAEAVVFTGIFVTSPILLHIAEFNTISWGIAAGLIATALASRHLSQGGTKNSLIAGAYAGFSMSIYQALFILYLTIVLLICIKKEWNAATSRTGGFIERNMPILGDVLKSVTASAVFYAVMDRLFKYFSGAHSDYLDNWVHLSSYTSEAGKEALMKVLGQSKGLLFGTDPTFLSVGAASLLLVWIGWLFTIRAQFDGRVTIITKLYAAALAIGALLVSISLIVLSAGYIPTRSLISFPFLYAVLSATAFRFHKIRSALWVAFGVALFANTYIANSLFYTDHVARQRDSVMAARLIDRIEEVGRGAFGESIPIAFMGQWQHELGGPALRVEIFGDSFFEHDGGNTFRITAYLRLLGCHGLVPLRLSEIIDEVQEAKPRPSWPAREAVFLTKIAVIVKLGELSNEQKAALLK